MEKIKHTWNSKEELEKLTEGIARVKCKQLNIPEGLWELCLFEAYQQVFFPNKKEK